MRIFIILQIIIFICLVQLGLYYYNINIYEHIFEYFYSQKHNISTNDNINLEENIKDLTHALEELKEL
jgi:hypothetical protein